MDQGFLIGDTLPFSVEPHPGICETPAMDEGPAIVGTFGAIDAGDDGDISVEVYARVGVSDFFGFEKGL
jgi:hypothetical protein